MAQADDKRALIERCTRFLSRHREPTLAESIALVAEEVTKNDRPDVYGRGGVIEEFEASAATLLGKPAAAFMPSGTMAQQIALRIHSDRSGIGAVAYHPTSHLELHEQGGLTELHGIRARLCGERHRLMTADDLAALPGEISTLLVELPQREIGGALPTWTDLEALLAVARDRDMSTHLDGARLWECGPFYERSPAEIAALFESVYVSFYKVLGGIAGAILAGDKELIAEARLWQRRYGGNLIHLYPFVLAARAGLRARGSKMAAYHHRALEIARTLTAIPGVTVTPDPPQTNMMHVYIAADPEHVERENLKIAGDDQTLLIRVLRPCAVPNVSCFELSVGDGAFEIEDDEITSWFTRLARTERA